MDDQEPTTRPTPLPEPPTARVRSVQWLNKPLPTTAPPARDRSRWLWILAIIVVSALAFLAGLTLATDGFTPPDVHPAPAMTPVP